jgi:hypothetical protein
MNVRDLHVEVQGDYIIVTLLGFGYRVTYHKAAGDPGTLISKSSSGRTIERAPMTQAEFYARAWKAANDKARELG